MTKTPRWMTSVIAEAKTCTTKMPWERGLRRQAFIVRRSAADAVVQIQARATRPAA